MLLITILTPSSSFDLEVQSPSGSKTGCKIWRAELFSVMKIRLVRLSEGREKLTSKGRVEILLLDNRGFFFCVEVSSIKIDKDLKLIEES
jgi:hypothetical protein